MVALYKDTWFEYKTLKIHFNLKVTIYCPSTLTYIKDAFSRKVLMMATDMI